MGTLSRLVCHVGSALDVQRLNSFVIIPRFSTVFIFKEQAGSLGFGDAVCGGLLVESFLMNIVYEMITIFPWEV